MRAVLVSLLVIVAMAAQPLLAIPAACTMGGARQTVTCASCCALKSCCAVTDQKQSVPLAAVHYSAADFLATLPLRPTTVSAPMGRPFHHSGHGHLSPHAHTLPPLALNCIQLI